MIVMKKRKGISYAFKKVGIFLTEEEAMKYIEQQPASDYEFILEDYIAMGELKKIVGNLKK